MTLGLGRASAARGGGGRGARLECAATGGDTEETTEEIAAAPPTPEQEEWRESDGARSATQRLSDDLPGQVESRRSPVPWSSL